MEEFFVCDNSDEQSNNAHFGSETDPLEEFGAEGSEGALATIATKPSFYRNNSIVFADPLLNTKNDDISSNDCEDKDEITILDSITICKKTGKVYKKYQFKIEKTSPMKCPQLNCLRTFPTKRHLTAHMRRVHCADRKRYICDQCGSGFSEPHLLKRHADTHSEQTVECPVCKVQLKKRSSLSTHLRTHFNQRSHECPVCKKKFARASSMAIHVKFVHIKGLLKCDECDERFSSRKQWSLHMTTHKQKKPTPKET